jgi:NTP pyrophosphatase (non-canonical NTP hydrolase)
MEPRGGYRGFFMKRLQEEVLELAIALDGGDEDDILQEAADVANFAMFIADFHQEKP